MTSKDAADLMTREELFLRSIEIVEEMEDQLELLERMLLAQGRLPDEVLGDYAARFRTGMPHVLFMLLRQLNRVKKGLRNSYDSLPPIPQPDL